MAGGSLDGVVAKRLDLPYQPGAGRGMLKIKRLRTHFYRQRCRYAGTTVQIRALQGSTD
jgi:ATP-dependent DNA ligase